MAATINDLWALYFLDFDSVVRGSLNDMEFATLLEQNGDNLGAIPDMWAWYLRNLGYTGTLNDMMSKWLREQGYTGSLPDMLYKALASGGGGGGIPFVLVIPGTAINPAWEAAKITARTTGTSVPIDGLAGIGDKYVSAYLNEFLTPNLLTYPIRADLTDAQRSFSIGRWLTAPYIHVLSSTRAECDELIEETTVPVEYGAAQSLSFVGTNTQTYDLSSLSFVPQTTLGSFTILVNGRWNVLNTTETMFGLYCSADATDWLQVRKSATNVLRAGAFINGALSGAGISPGHDFDVAVNGGINTDGWMLLEVAIGANGNVNLTFRSFFNNNSVSGTQAIAAASVDTEWQGVFNRLILGSQPDTTTEPFAGRINRCVVVEGQITTGQWDDIRQNNVDALTQVIRSRRHLDLVGNTPFGHRNRITGELYLSSTGTPALVAGTATIPIDASWTGMVHKFTVTTTSAAYPIPESDGLWVLMTGSAAQDAINVGVRFGDAPVATLVSPSQVVHGPRAVVCGGGQNVALICASGTVDVWMFPLLSDTGP